MTDNIKTKWNLENSFKIPVYNESLGNDLFGMLKDKLQEVKYLSELNDKKFISDIKDRIEQEFKLTLNEYKSNNEITKKNQIAIEKYITSTINKNIDSIANKLFNDSNRDSLFELCNKFEQAYSENNFNKMNTISKQIEKLFDGSKLYKDVELTKRAEKDMTINNLLQNKIKNMEQASINEIEMQLIDRLI